MPHKISSSTTLHFEATKPQMIHIPKRLEPSIPRPLCQMIHPPTSSTISSCSSTFLPPVPRIPKQEKKAVTTASALIKLLSPQSSTYLPMPPGAERKLSLASIAEASPESLNFKEKVSNYLVNQSQRVSKKKTKKLIQPKKKPTPRKRIIGKPQKTPVS